MKNRRVAIAAGALVVLALAAWGLAAWAGRPEAAPDAPNVIVVVLDDATAEMVTDQTMPTALRGLADRGTSFSNFIAVSPLCCPSRANLLTGQYGHNNNVLKNDYRRLKKKSQILPSWLQEAGYRTLHVGKYLNNFTAALDEPEQVPAGWDEWFTMTTNGYYDYEVSDNGDAVSYGSEPSDYVTRVINRKATQLVTDYAAREEPFYLQVDQFAPHPRPTRTGERCGQGAVPDPRDAADVAGIDVPTRRSRNEANISDKPWFVRPLRRLDSRRVRLAEIRFQCAAAALPAVDRGLQQLIEALREAGELDETVIMLTSDNGYFFAEHRLRSKKEFAYEENLRMPLMVRAPMLDGGRSREVAAVAGMIDIAPTILELASGEPCAGDCRLLDGRSLVPLLDGEIRRWPQSRALLIELDQQPGGVQRRARPCSYIGVRTEDEVFIQYRTAAANGTPCRPTTAREYYDLATDPEQLDNLATDDSRRRRVERLRQRMLELEGCAGNVAELGDDPNACE